MFRLDGILDLRQFVRDDVQFQSSFTSGGRVLRHLPQLLEFAQILPHILNKILQLVDLLRGVRGRVFECLCHLYPKTVHFLLQ